jgi:hypothetical protein
MVASRDEIRSLAGHFFHLGKHSYEGAKRVHAAIWIETCHNYVHADLGRMAEIALSNWWMGSITRGEREVRSQLLPLLIYKRNFSCTLKKTTHPSV